MDFLVRFGHAHLNFRLPELEALAELEGIDLKVKEYSNESPFCIITLSSPSAASILVRRAILVQQIYELWGDATTLDGLVSQVRENARAQSDEFGKSSFKFTFDTFRGQRAPETRLEIINRFSFLPWKGPIDLRRPDNTFVILEFWPENSPVLGITDPDRLFFGRRVTAGARDLPTKYDLKKRAYISTTSMDAELALVTANMAHAAPGRLFYDPFVGTGSFPVACAHFGAVSFGSDIDGRSFRGEGASSKAGGNPPRDDSSSRGIFANFEQYGLMDLFGDAFSADLTNTPIRTAPGLRFFDGIVCDPPYGVREGLKVLGCRDPEKTPWVVEAGRKTYKNPTFIPPKKPYSFDAMLADILVFAARTLVDGGRLAFWMPTVNEEEGKEIEVPRHPSLRLISVCSQDFNKWSRVLITYVRIPDSPISPEPQSKTEPQNTTTAPPQRTEPSPSTNVTESEVDSSSPTNIGPGNSNKGITADELNPFRKAYFNRFLPTK